MQSISINDILDLTDDDYESYINKLLKDDDVASNLDALDDELLEVVEARPVDVGRVCQINYRVFSKSLQKDMRSFFLAYNFNTHFISTIVQHDMLQSKAIFLKGISFCLKNKANFRMKCNFE